MGWSMGGYGVLLAAETYPHLFSAVVATAPAVWPTYQDMMNGPGDAFDSAADFAAHDVIGHADRLAGTPLLVECGTVDPFIPSCEISARGCAGEHDGSFGRTNALGGLEARSAARTGCGRRAPRPSGAASAGAAPDQDVAAARRGDVDQAAIAQAGLVGDARDVGVAVEGDLALPGGPVTQGAQRLAHERMTRETRRSTAPWSATPSVARNGAGSDR